MLRARPVVLVGLALFVLAVFTISCAKPTPTPTPTPVPTPTATPTPAPTATPIYEFLYDTASEEGFQDGECLLDHSYFLAHQLKGLSEKEAESVVSEIEKLSKH